MKVGRPRLTTRKLTPRQLTIWILLSRIGGWVPSDKLGSIRSCDGLVIRGLAHKRIAGIVYQGLDPTLIPRYTYYRAKGKAVA